MHRLSYKLMLLFTVAVTLAGIGSMLPASRASYECVLGYKAYCTFAPASALFCFFIAGTTCFIRSTFIKDQSGSPADRFKRHRKSLIPVVLVLILALGSTIWFYQVKQNYIDSATSASMEENK